MSDERRVKVVLAVGLAPNLLEDIRKVDPRLDVTVLDNELMPLYLGRSAGEGSPAQERFAELMADAEVLYGLMIDGTRPRRLATAPKLRWYQASVRRRRAYRREFIRSAASPSQPPAASTRHLSPVRTAPDAHVHEAGRRTLEAQQEKR
jgi:hypothetical protein